MSIKEETTLFEDNRMKVEVDFYSMRKGSQVRVGNVIVEKKDTRTIVITEV